MRFVVLGSGMQGTACAYDLALNPATQEVVVADVDVKRAEEVANTIKKLNSKAKISAVHVNVEDQKGLVEFLKPFDVAVSAVPYFYNLRITEACVASNTHMVDMGGNTDIVLQQRTFNDAAEKAGVTIFPDCGLAPGMANILAAHGIGKLDEVDSVKIRVGGLPQDPQPPLNYHLFFSIHGLINEYLGKAVILKNSKVEYVDTLTDVEELSFRAPVGDCEAFNTLGGLSTLPWTFEGKVKEMNYKTVRYPGHCAQIKLMADLGLMDENPIEVRGQKVTPREVFASVVTPVLTEGDGKDVIVVRVVVEGTKGGEGLRTSCEIMDFFEEKTGFTAMMRTTAYPVAIIAQMMADGTITKHGVLALETDVPTDHFIEELGKRNIQLQSDTVPLKKHVHC